MSVILDRRILKLFSHIVSQCYIKVVISMSMDNIHGSSKSRVTFGVQIMLKSHIVEKNY